MTDKYVASDPIWTLQEWKDFIEELMKHNGNNAIMYTDAGYNNVSLLIKQLPKKSEDKSCS